MSGLMKEGNVDRAGRMHGDMKEVKECFGVEGMDGRKMIMDEMDHRK
jgi:pentatricopeptide repeat protein